MRSYYIGTISAREVSVSFEPTTSLSSVNGELTFGGTDSSKFTGSITFAYVHSIEFDLGINGCINNSFSRPLTTTSPASEFWGISQSITYGTAGTSILSTTAGIVGESSFYYALRRALQADTRSNHRHWYHPRPHRQVRLNRCTTIHAPKYCGD